MQASMEASYSVHLEKITTNIEIVKIQYSLKLQQEKFDFPNFVKIESLIQNKTKGLLTF